MAGTKALVTAIRRTPYSNDGFTVLEAMPGETFPINSDLVQGLVDEKFVERVAVGEIVPAVVSAAKVGETPSETVITAAQAQEIISSATAIPADWRDLHHLQIVKLAKTFDPEVKSKTEAVAVLEAEEAKAKA